MFVGSNLEFVEKVKHGGSSEEITPVLMSGVRMRVLFCREFAASVVLPSSFFLG